MEKTKTEQANETKEKKKLFDFRQFFSTRNITKAAMLTAAAFGLLYLRFALPFFPPFLELHFSDLPTLIGGLALGPAWGMIILTLKILLKLLVQGTSTMFVGDLADFLIGAALILPPSILYRIKKTGISALIGIICGVVLSVAVAILANVFLLVPLYIELFFGGNPAPLVNMCKVTAPNITEETLYVKYAFYICAPFNLMRVIPIGILSFLAYKPLERFFH